MEKKIKFIVITIIAILSFSLLIIININLMHTPSTLESVEDINLTVNYDNGTVKIRENFTLSDGKTTAFDALERWCDIKYDNYGWGIIVREIDGIGGNWLYFVNDLSPSVGSDMYPLKSGDNVTWKHV